jgi:hypothetical protein
MKYTGVFLAATDGGLQAHPTMGQLFLYKNGTYVQRMTNAKENGTK